MASSNVPRYGRKEGKLARCPAPHFEAWKLDNGAKVTGRIKMAEGSVRSASISLYNVVTQ